MGMIFKFEGESTTTTKKRYCKRRFTLSARRKALFQTIEQDANSIIEMYKK